MSETEQMLAEAKALWENLERSRSDRGEAAIEAESLRPNATRGSPGDTTGLSADMGQELEVKDQERAKREADAAKEATAAAEEAHRQRIRAGGYKEEVDRSWSRARSRSASPGARRPEFEPEDAEAALTSGTNGDGVLDREEFTRAYLSGPFSAQRASHFAGKVLAGLEELKALEQQEAAAHVGAPSC